MQPSRDCVQKTLKRLEDRTQGKVLHQIIYSLISSNAVIQQRTAIALTRLVREQDLCHVFVDRKGIDVLIELLVGCKKPGNVQKEAAGISFHIKSCLNSPVLHRTVLHTGNESECAKQAVSQSCVLLEISHMGTFSSIGTANIKSCTCPLITLN